MPPKMTIRVLVIDDDQDDCRLIKDLLGDAARAEFTVDDAHTAQEGFYQLQQTHHRYDVILLDYKLPDSDGITFLQKLHELHFQTPIIIVTSHGDKNLQDQAMEMGAVEYLEKGTFGAALLERTCLYAIGVQEKRRQNGDGAPGVGVLIEQLVGLTRQSVKAQTEAAQQTRELRQDFAQSLKRHTEETREQHDKILAEVKSIKSTWRWLLEWVVDHPMVAIFIFLCLVLVAVLGVLLLDALDVGKLKDLKGLKTTMLAAIGVEWTT
jgi:DNA-binding response OmpR family regulator